MFSNSAAAFRLAEKLSEREAQYENQFRVDSRWLFAGDDE
jgi:hypothetical protein